MPASPGDNRGRQTIGENNPSRYFRMISANAHNPLGPGAVVVISLANPREKFWGLVLSLAPEGIGVSGMDLSSFEDLGRRVKEGEAITPTVVFFPMHRIERAEADLPLDGLPSLSQRFASITGLTPAQALGPASGIEGRA
jgi:hypothetical protein